MSATAQSLELAPASSLPGLMSAAEETANATVVGGETTPIVSGNVTLQQRQENCKSTLHLPWGPIEQCRRAIIGSAAGAVALAGSATWYTKGFSSHLRVTNEHWFGRDTYSGGIDKLSHAFSFYAGTRLLHKALVWSGTEKEEALQLSLVTNLATGLAIEVFDGLSRKPYGFSKEDLISDAAGAGLGYLLEKYPRLDELLAYRMMYRPAGKKKFNPIDNYEGQTFLLSLKLAGVTPMSPSNPLRYLELAVGYGAKGYKGDYAGATDSGSHQRSIYIGVMLNMNEVLRRTVFARNAKPTTTQKVTEGIFDYVQLPGTLLSHKNNF